MVVIAVQKEAAASAALQMAYLYSIASGAYWRIDDRRGRSAVPLKARLYASANGHIGAQKEEGAIAAVKKGLALLDRHLAKNTYLVGHTVTLADIVGVCNLYHGYTKVFTASCMRPVVAARRVTPCCTSAAGGGSTLLTSRCTQAHVSWCLTRRNSTLGLPTAEVLARRQHEVFV